MSSDSSWHDLPATRKQIDLLISMAIDSFENMTRGDASRMIEDWLEIQNDPKTSSFNQKTLEDYK